MAVLQKEALNSYLKNPSMRYRIVLVFGPDRGLVSERASAILDKLQQSSGGNSDDPFGLTRIAAEDLNSDPQRLANEAYTISLFGGTRFIHAKAHGARNLQDQIAPLLKDLPQDTFIIIEAGDVKKTTAFRKLIEKSDDAAAIACFADDTASLNQLVSDELEAFGLSMTKDARQRLVSQLGGDRLASRREIEKLCLFAADKGTISEEDVLALSGDSSVLSADALSDAAALGQMPALMDALARMDAGSLSPSAAGPMILRNFQILHKARIMVEQGVPAAQVVERVTPPIFFMRKGAVRKQLGMWTVARLERALALLSEAVLKSRQQQGLATAHLGDALIRIAGNARRG